jgi:hypothetical protein
MFAGDVRRARSIGRRITHARRYGDREDQELAYRKRDDGIVARFGPDARREVEAGASRRGASGGRRMLGKPSGRPPWARLSGPGS